MNVQAVCQEVVQSIEGGLNCALIGLDSGRVVAFSTRSGVTLSSNELERMIKLCGGMFRGKLIGQYIQSVSADRQMPAEFVEEAQVSTVSTNHFFVSIPAWGGVALMLSAEDSVSWGLCWAAIRQARDQLKQWPMTEVGEALAFDMDEEWRQTLRWQPADAEEGADSEAPADMEASSLLRAERRIGTKAAADKSPPEPASKVAFGARSAMYRPGKAGR